MSRISTTAHLRSRMGLLALALVAIVAVVAEYVVPFSARNWVANAGWLTGAIVATIGVNGVRRRSGSRDRGGWALLCWACVAWLVGELFWILYGLTGYPSSPNVADICWLAVAVLTAASVMRLGPSPRGRTVTWLELAPLAVAACALLGALLWDDIRQSTLAAPAEATALAYPVVFVFAALVMLQSVVTGTLDVTASRGMALVVAGLVIDAISFVLWTPLLLDASYTAGTYAVDALWTIGMLFVGLGAAISGPPTAIPDVERAGERRGAVLPFLTFAIVALVQALLILSHASPGALVLLTLALLITGATLAVRGAQLRLQQAVLYARLKQREAELRDINRRLNEESRRDVLTGLANRLRLEEDLAQLSAVAARHGGTYCLVLFDLDRFKDYNDALGHQAGDDALRAVAALLDEEARAGDRVYRYGGEELLLVLADQGAEAGAATAERQRAALDAAAIPHPLNPPFGVITVSAGVAAAQAGETTRDVLRRADEALYWAKSSGRNQIAIAASPTAVRAAAR